MPREEQSKIRVAIYARISDDRRGERYGVQRQIKLARERIAQRPEWVEVACFDDNDISAMSGKRRPEYEKLFSAVQRGDVDLVLCFALSRLWRLPSERIPAIETLAANACDVETVDGMRLDLSSPMGQTMARMMGEVDTLESALKRERMRGSTRDRAERGLYHTSGSRPFGYVQLWDRDAVNPETGEKQRRTMTDMFPHPAEAEIVREMARRVLGGEPTSSVARDLNARGITTTAGGPHRPGSVVRILASAVISGRRETIRRSDYDKTRPLCGEIVADGHWDAIISVEESDRLRQMLSDPSRAPIKARKTLLTGVLRCALCDQPMVSRPRDGRPRYVCNKRPGAKGCGGVSTRRPATDEYVADQLIARLAASDMGDRLRRRTTSKADPALADRVRADQQALDTLGDQLDDGEITRAEWQRRDGRIRARLERNTAALQANGGDGTETAMRLAEFRGDGRTEHARYVDMTARWKRLTDDQRRPLVHALLDHVTVTLADKSSRRFQPDRFTLAYHSWVESPADENAEQVAA